jgi:hypothetical protein
MFAGMIPIYGGAVWRNWARLFAYAALLVVAAVTLAWWTRFSLVQKMCCRRGVP